MALKKHCTRISECPKTLNQQKTYKNNLGH